MTTSWSSLYLDFASGMTDYIPRHTANYSRIQSCLDYLYALTGGGRSMLDVPLGLQQIFDRNGIIGKASYKPPAGTLSGPNYNLVVPAGAFWSTATFYSKATSTTISMSGQSTGTYYIVLDGVGNPTVSASASALALWSFSWDSGTHVIAAVTRYAGVAILFDGDDYADALTSTALGETFESIAERFEFVELALGGISDHLSYNEAGSSGLDFYYKAGRVRNDNVIWSVVAGHLTLTNTDVNYVEVNPADGVVSSNLVGFTVGQIPLYEVTCAGGVITVVTDKRAWLGAGGAGGGGGHTQNTDTGTTAAQFKLLMGVTGAPSLDAKLAVERGDEADVAIRWNEALQKWQFTEDGTTWTNLGDLNVDLGAQEISKYVPIDTPPEVLSDTARGTSGDYEELDLSSYLTDAPDGVAAVALRIIYWDTEDPATIGSNVKFRKGGTAPGPTVAQTFYSAAHMDWSRPQMLVIGLSATNILEYFVTASGADTSYVKIYLIGYYKTILGVGTQDVSFVSAGHAVPADDFVELNLENFANRALINYFKIDDVGGLMTGDYDVEFYANDTFDEAGLLYKAVGIHSDEAYEDWLPWMHRDGDGSSELHIRITNHDASQAGTFDITIRCEMFA